MTDDIQNQEEKYVPDPLRLIEAVEELALPEHVAESIKSSIRGQKSSGGGIFMPAIIGGPTAARTKGRPLNFVFVPDASSSMDKHKAKVRDLLKRLKNYAVWREQQDHVRIQIAAVPFGSKPLGVVPYERANLIPDSAFDGYAPSGSTAMWDGMMYALLGDTGYGYELSSGGANSGRYNVVLITDTEENNSKDFTASEIAEVIKASRKKRNRVFGAIVFDGFFSTRAEQLQRLLDMGFLERNIRFVGDLKDNSTFDEMFENLQRSMKNQSIAHSLHQSTNQPGVDPGIAADDMMFQP